jgi:serine/threonine protein kinase
MNEPKSEETIFAEALRLPPADRSAYLVASTGGNPSIRQRVESLLKSYEAGDFLEDSATPAIGRTIALSTPLTEKAGDKIGRYKLLQQIGEGGCGVVYMAEQGEPVRRRVALKIIKAGMDTKNVIARFEAERQALAIMDHPNIAKVLDAGTTQTGRPYFVMELVRGMKVTDYCDEAKLSLHARLEVFMQVCHAIQHAHQKGIIHRDIKPSNILVTINDGVPVPKVIDFGIAKATGGQRLTDKTVFTAFEQFIGTPAYMSPEQAMMTSLDIDTRSDIYALGVLLYELLTGKTPFDAKDLLAIGLDEMRRTIREDEPERPSTRLSTLPDNELNTTALSRRLDAPRLITQLRGDLDWIVMKCLEKERSRRYETANGLARDIERHLSDEPIVARPPSRAYRFQKMFRRNKLAFVSAAVIAVVLMAATGISVWQAALATQRLAESETISKFLTEVFQSPDPARDARTITVAETLGIAAKKLETELINQPARRAKLQRTLGVTYQNLGLYREAIPLQEWVRDFYLTTVGPEDTNTIDAMHLLAASYQRVERFDEALKLQERVLALDRKVFGREDPNTLRAMMNLSRTYGDIDQVRDAVSLGEQTHKLARTKYGATNQLTFQSMENLAVAYSRDGRLAEATRLNEELLTLQKATLVTNHADILITMHSLAVDYLNAGRAADALTLNQQIFQVRRSRYGPNHPLTLGTMVNLGASYIYAGRAADAVQLLEETTKLCLTNVGPDSSMTVESVENLLGAYEDTGLVAEADRTLNELLAPAIERHPRDPELLHARGVFFAKRGRWTEAVSDLQRVVELRPDNHEDWHYLAGILVQSGQLDRYREYCRKSLERFAKSNEPSIAHRIAKDCLILPSAGVDLETVNNMAERSLSWGTNGPFGPALLSTKALAEYRRGHFDIAVERAEHVLSILSVAPQFSATPWMQVQTYAILAMGRQQLKQHDLARAALTIGQKISDEKLPKLDSGNLGENWLDVIIADKLMREATALVGGSPEATVETK